MRVDLEDCIIKTVAQYPARHREDLTQELWLVALERLPGYDPSRGSLGAYMYLRLHGACKDYLSKYCQEGSELSEELLKTDPVDLDLQDPPLTPGARDFIVQQLEAGYTIREIFVKFPDVHGYKSLKSLYNQLY